MTLLRAALASLCLLLPAMQAKAEPRPLLGFGRIFTNDYLGDGQDRWRTGSYTVSGFTGTSRELPSGFGQLLEWRLRSEVIAPASIKVQAPGDRRYAGILDLSLLTHAQRGASEVSFGAGVAVVGPQSGVGNLQSWLHERLGIAPPQVLGSQIENRIIPHVEAEIGRSYALGGAELRPFAEARAGDETLLRLGADLRIGGVEGGVFQRDIVSGQRVQVFPKARERRSSLTLGADIAAVASSAWLPEGGPAPESQRSRIRAAVEVNRGAFGITYGAAWLSPEFEGQSEAQVVGSLRVSLSF